MEPAPITCPECGATLKPAHAVAAGKLIKCPKCEIYFPAPAGESAGVRPREQPAALVRHKRENPNAGPEDFSVGEAGDAESGRSTRPVKRRTATKKAKSSMLLWVLLGVGAVVLLGGAGLLAVILHVVPGISHPGYASPDAALDAYVEAIRTQDVAAYKASYAQRPDDLRQLEQATRTAHPDASAAEIEASWKNLLKALADLDWAEGQYRRFPAEIQGDSAIIVCIIETSKFEFIPNRYTKYQFTKIRGSWYLTGETMGSSKELDPNKYDTSKR